MDCCQGTSVVGVVEQWRGQVGTHTRRRCGLISRLSSGEETERGCDRGWVSNMGCCGHVGALRPALRVTHRLRAPPSHTWRAGPFPQTPARWCCHRHRQRPHACGVQPDTAALQLLAGAPSILFGDSHALSRLHTRAMACRNHAPTPPPVMRL